jgi:hypothetical protein
VGRPFFSAVQSFPRTWFDFDLPGSCKSPKRFLHNAAAFSGGPSDSFNVEKHRTLLHGEKQDARAATISL